MAKYFQKFRIYFYKDIYWNSLKLQQIEKLKIKNTIPRFFS